MTSPYEILGIGRDADPEAIRRRYLELVRQYPPEREPQKFAEIRSAYDELRDPITNLQNRLFNLRAGPSFDELIVRTQPDFRQTRIPTDFLLSLARS